MNNIVSQVELTQWELDNQSLITRWEADFTAYGFKTVQFFNNKELLGIFTVEINTDDNEQS